MNEALTIESHHVVAEYAKTLKSPANDAERAVVAMQSQPPSANSQPDESVQHPNVERLALQEAWELLKKDLQDHGKDDSMMGSSPDTFESVISVAHDAQTKLNDQKRIGGGKPKQYYNKFCQKAYAHRSMFDVFPSTNEYVSVFCGSIKTLIKVSVNYVKISEGIARALEEITEQVEFAQRQVESIHTKHTQNALAKLYKEIFLYLKDCTEWFAAKSKARALRSFNEDFYNVYADRLKLIREKSQLLYQEVTFAGILNVQTQMNMRENLEQERRRQFDHEIAQAKIVNEQLMTGPMQRKLLEQLQEMWTASLVTALKHETGIRATGMLEEIWVNNRWQIEQRRGAPSLEAETDWIKNKLSRSPGSSESSQSKTTQHRYSRDDLLNNSSDLETFIIGNSVNLLHTLPSSPFAPMATAEALRTWLGQTDSSILWVQGTPVSQYPNNFSALAGSLINAALSSSPRTPIIFHFCEPLTKPDFPTGTEPEEASFISLVYSLIRQIIALLDFELVVSTNFSKERFLRLVSKPRESWRESISLLDDLFRLSPGILFCVIDNMNDLDYGDGMKMCADLVRLMRKREQHSKESGAVFKCLFTTSGYSRALDRELDVKEIVVDIETEELTPGIPSAGESFVLVDD